jgi:predicted acylesterase/phospholipase RssA
VASDDKLLECDIVMAGGVTSGIIYPGAVAKIARRFSFRSIGGTSVGAIAAAVTAAAEYGRRTGRNPHSFSQIAGLPKSLGAPAPDRHTRLFHLFTAEPKTKGLYALLMPAFQGGGKIPFLTGMAKVAVSVWQVLLTVLVALAAGMAVTGFLIVEGHWGLGLLAAIATLALVIVAFVGATLCLLAFDWLVAWRDNGYGLCTGLTSMRSADVETQDPFEGLTPWLHRIVQRAAGRAPADPPLTFGDLWGAQAAPAPSVLQTDPRAPRGIELAMIASDISRNRTLQLPFIETPSPLYVELSVLRRYFPEPIVQWMEERAGTYDARVEQRKGVIRLPRPHDLPVVFAARLSLSFPILLSALPLLAPHFAKRKKETEAIVLTRVWFSDGGLTSNFPIHFFDSPLPSRPTFCLNLIDYEAEMPANASDNADDENPEMEAAPRSEPAPDNSVAQPLSPARSAKNRPATIDSADPLPGDKVWKFVSMPKGNQFIPAQFTAFDEVPGVGLGSFLFALVNTARFWSDNQMLLAPGVRDRVVNIALREDEGGLNLDMKKNVIDELDLRGRAAGMLLAARFNPDEKIDPETGQENTPAFASHRWVRYRNFMSAFEDLSRRFALSRRASDSAALERNEPTLADMIDGNAKEKLGYEPPLEARAFYRKATDDLEALAIELASLTRLNEFSTFDRPREFGVEKTRVPRGGAPRPKMRVRLRPLGDDDPRAETADLPGNNG